MGDGLPPANHPHISILEGKTEDAPIPDQLFGDVIDVLRRHIHFEKPWHYVVTALFVFQAHVATVLPAVFYLFVGGPFGQGKTALLILLAKLTDGVLFENVSAPRLARSMPNGKTVCFDEYDASRGKEYGEIRDALLRQGYKADAAPYARWDATKRAAEDVPIYGPKAAAYRGTVEDALQSRGYPIPTAKVKGEGGFDLVLANMWPDLRSLPERLRAWGEFARDAFPREKVKEIAHSPAFRRKVKQAVPEMGANRESELGTIAVLVAEMVGVEAGDELSKANELAKNLTGEGEAEVLAELTEIVLLQAGPLQTKLTKEGPDVRLPQKPLKDELNRRRKERGDSILYDGDFAKLRRELNVKDEWLLRPKNRVVWALPHSFLKELEEGMPNSPNPSNLRIDSEVSRDSLVSLGSFERPLARVLHEGIAGTCKFCRKDGRERLVIEPRGSTDKIRACSPCIEPRFDLGPPPAMIGGG